jgi:hypothetical protein
MNRSFSLLGCARADYSTLIETTGFVSLICRCSWQHLRGLWCCAHCPGKDNWWSKEGCAPFRHKVDYSLIVDLSFSFLACAWADHTTLTKTTGFLSFIYRCSWQHLCNLLCCVHVPRKDHLWSKEGCSYFRHKVDYWFVSYASFVDTFDYQRWFAYCLLCCTVDNSPNMCMPLFLLS